MTTEPKPFFHVLLSDRDEWVIEVEWPDGTLERIRSFKKHALAANWIITQAEAWLKTQDIFTEQTVSL
jgi:hypothetical protein